MNPVFDFFRRLFSTSDWPARWNCGRWTDFHGWLYIISDLLIWSAYFFIPLMIVLFISRKRSEGLRFNRVYFLFAAFILACGSTHLLDAVMFYYPAYRLNALVRFATGIISWLTVFTLIRALPTAFALKSPKALEQEVALRQSAEAELRVQAGKLATAQQIARLGYWQWDARSGALTWSEDMHRIWGAPPDFAPTYASYMGSIHPADRAFVQGIIDAALPSKSYPQFHHRIVAADTGAVKHILARGEVVVGEDGVATGLHGTVQDVTEHRTAELHALARSRQLQRVNAELENFAYIASHDLQEPLRKVRTFSGLLEKSVASGATADTATYVEKINASVGRMQRLIDDVLQFAHLAQDNARFLPVALSEVAASAISDLEVRIAETGALVQCGELHTVDGVPGQLHQLFSNLIGNALKFAKPGVPPAVRISSALVPGSALPPEDLEAVQAYTSVLSEEEWPLQVFCRIRIQDNGIGFEEEYARRIFGIFQRLHSRSAYEGTGIGLAVCKKIAELHHGLIRAEGLPGEGATFILTLPQSQHAFTPVSGVPVASATVEA